MSNNRGPNRVRPVTQLPRRNAQAANRVPLSERAENLYHLIYSQFRHQSVEFNRLLLITVFMVGFGLIMVLSSSSIDAIKADSNAYSIFLKQVLWALLGFAGLIAASLMPHRFFSRLSVWLYGTGMIMQLAVLFTPLGIDVNGNRAWLRLPGGLSLQPSEFLKLAMILGVAKLLADREHLVDNRKLFLRPILVQSGLAMVAVVLGKDLGTTLVMALILFLMLYIFGLPSWQFRLPLLGAGVAVVFFLVTGPSRMARILAWINPNSTEGQLYSWQAQHGIWALAAGQFIGVGIGMSKLKWSWIPEVENDYIFAIIGEELGMIGALAVIGLFLLLAYSLYRIYQRCIDRFSQMVTMGFCIWMLVQAMTNIAVVLQLLPVLGVPLPLFSSGGSSLIAGLAGIGVVLSFERENYKRLGGRGAGRAVAPRGSGQ
jgi:cell division protein FtsW